MVILIPASVVSFPCISAQIWSCVCVYVNIYRYIYMCIKCRISFTVTIMLKKRHKEEHFPAIYLLYVLLCLHYTVLCSLHQRQQGACNKPVCYGIHALPNSIWHWQDFMCCPFKGFHSPHSIKCYTVLTWTNPILHIAQVLQGEHLPLILNDFGQRTRKNFTWDIANYLLRWNYCPAFSFFAFCIYFLILCMNYIVKTREETS